LRLDYNQEETGKGGDCFSISFVHVQSRTKGCDNLLNLYQREAKDEGQENKKK